MIKRTSALTLLVLLIIVALLIGWYWSDHNKIPAPKSQPVPTVKVETLKKQAVPIRVTAYGSSIFPNSIDLLANTTGNITSIRFKSGQAVHQDQVLFTIHSNVVSNQVKALKAKMLDDKNSYSRYLKLHQNYPGGATASTLADFKFKYQQSLENYHEALRLAIVRSPVNGTISDTTLAIGSFVQSGDLLAHLVNPKIIQVRYSLPSRYADQARIGQTVTFQANGDTHNYSGTVTYVSPAMDPESHLLTLRANLFHATQLKANRFGEITQILDPNYQTFAIPQSVSNTDAKGFYVFVVKNGKVQKAYFKPGRVTAKGYLIIQSGLSAGESIIVSDTSSLNVGETVRVANS